MDEIYDYIANDKPDAARRWLMNTMAQFAWLSKTPLVDESRDDVRPGLRSISHGNYVIYFRCRPDCVEVVRVLHGTRDTHGLL